MFNWFKQAAGAVGNLFNQGSRYVGNTFSNADRQRRLWEQQARQQAQQVQRQVQQQAQQQVQQVQRQVPKVPQVDFSAVIKQLQALRNQPQVQKIGYATNPINQFKELNKQVVNPLNQFGQNQVNRAMKTLPTLQRANQQALQNPIVKAGLNVPFSNPVSAFNAVSNPRKTFNDTRGAREMFFGKTGELLNTGKSLAPASVVLGVAPYEIAGKALGIKPLENRARQVRNQAFGQYAKQSQTGINPVGSQQQRDIDSGGLKGLGAFARAMGAKGAGAGLEIAPVVTGSAAGVPLKSALLRGGTLGAGGNIGYSAVSGYYSPQRSAQEKAIQLGTDIAGGYGGELLGYGLGRAMGKKGAKTIQDTKGYTGNLIDEMNTKFRQGKIGEKQFRAFVIDDFTKKNGRVPMPADVDAFVDVATGRTNRPYVEAIRQKYASNQAQLPVGRGIADTAPKNPLDGLLNEARKYKSAANFERKYNPTDGSWINDTKPKGMFEADNRVVRLNIFPKDVVQGKGITKAYTLNLLKKADSKGVKKIIPSLGSYTKDGTGFMDRLASEGWVKKVKTGTSGIYDYEISPKIKDWKTTTQLTDLYNQATKNKPIYELAPKPSKKNIPEQDIAAYKEAQAYLAKWNRGYDPNADYYIKQSKALEAKYPDIGSNPTPPQVAKTGGNLPPETPPTKPDAQVPVKANRGLIESVKESPMTKSSLRNALESEQYTVLPNKVTMNQAVKTINKNPQAALNEVLSTKPRTAQLNAQGLILAEKAQKRGDFETAQKIFQAMAPGNTKEGQAIQILSVWGKTKPEGVVKYAQKVVDDANNTLIVAGKNPSITLSADKAANFRKQAEAISKMADGKDKLIATQKMLNEIHQQVPASMAEKAQSLLYYTQLLNPKTAVRNIIGNTGFALGETAKDIVGAPIDIALTGARRLIGQDAKRSIYFPNPIKQVRAGLAGGAEAAKEARFGVNLSGLEGQLQIGNKQPAFRNPVGRGLDKAMQFELSVPDRTFYTSRYQQTLDNLMKGAKVSKPTKEMLDIADYDAKYATFQDDSLAAKAFMNIKKGLNLNKDFGIGSFVINYPKTPGNLLARGIDYSPAGFIKSTLEIAKPIFRQGPFNQKKFIDSFSRALVGTGGLVGTGALLHKAGIITGAPSKDKDVNAQDKATGLGAYRINVDALRRFVTSGFKPQKLEDGDTTLTYDWFQPAAIGISMGANIDETQASDKGAVGKLVKMLGAGGSSIAAGAETLANQPLVQGLTKLTGNGGGITQGMLATLQGVPASFVPTLLYQVNQLTDNTSRSTYDPNPAVQAINMVKAKIPGLASTLQPQVNPEGQNNERYQNGSNNPLNVFLNPAFVGTYNADDVQKEITRLENSTGQTSQYPSIIKNTQKVNGQDVQLSAQQVTDMQRVQGQLTKEAYAKIMSDPAYSRLSDTDKVKKLQNIITQANQIARSRVLSDQNGKDQITVTAEGKKPKVAKAKKPKKGRTAKAKKGRKGRVAKAVKLPSIRLSAPRKVAIAKVAKLRSPKVRYPRLAKSSKTPKIKV